MIMLNKVNFVWTWFSQNSWFGKSNQILPVSWNELESKEFLETQILYQVL